MSPLASQPTEGEWLRNKAVIRHMYLVSEMPLKCLVVEMGNRGLIVTKAQLEYKLKQWGFRRNVDKATWLSIDHAISKRKREGKGSQVILSGKRLKPSTIEKETNRHRDTTIFSQLRAQNLSSPPASLTDTQVVICTPPPLAMEFEWPRTLPWLKFQTLHLSPLISMTDLGGRPKAGDMRLRQATRSWSLFSAILIPYSQIESTRSHPQPPWVAALLGKSMPESYPEEHLRRAQVLLDGSTEEVLSECLSIVIYNFSNDLSGSFDDEAWAMTINILRDCGIMNLQVSLKDHMDLTIRAFMHNLSRAAVSRLTDPRRINVDDRDDTALLKWLLTSGQSPDIVVTSSQISFSASTALQAAIRIGSLDLMGQLLDAGANVNLRAPHGDLDTPLELAQKMHTLGGSVISRMARLLLRHGASSNLNSALHLAILRSDKDLVQAILQQGADLCGTLRLQNGFTYEETALSVAATVDEETTRFILDLLASQYPSKSLESFVTADIFVAAAAEAKDDTIRLLHTISSAGNSANHCGLTPLHAAARKGHLSTCRVLHELYGRPRSTIQCVSPIHLASYGGHTNVVQFLLVSGADVNAVATVGGTQQHKVLVKRCGLSTVTGYPPRSLTPLEMLLTRVPIKNGFCGSRHLASMAQLIQHGAWLTGCEVLIAARHRDFGLLSTVLRAGGCPNQETADGSTAIQIALDIQNSQCKQSRQRGADVATLLLEKGAKLAGGEVAKAVLLDDQNLVDRLLSRGASLSETDENGMTALEAAIWSKNHRRLDRMLQECPQIYDPASLCAAIMTGMQSVTERLVANRPTNTHEKVLEATAIGLAAKLGDMDLLRRLLACLPLSNVAALPGRASDTGAFTTRRNLAHKDFWRSRKCFKGSPLALAAMGKATEAFCELLRAGSQPDRLTWVIICDGNDLSMAQILVDNNYRPTDDITGVSVLIRSPLIGPIKLRNKELVLLLIRAGAEVNENHQNLLDGRSPLQVAVELDDLDIMDCLLQAGAEVNAPPALCGGATALQLAAMTGYVGLAKKLLDLGADVDAPPAQRHGRTALEGAAEHGRLDMLELLICHGALTTGAGQRQYVRSLKFARHRGHYAAAELLRGLRDWTVEDEKVYQEDVDENQSHVAMTSFDS